MPLPWSRRLIEAGRGQQTRRGLLGWALGDPAPAASLPDFGSVEWHALADDDPAKLAAAVVSAEVQRYEEATAADRLARELAEARYVAQCLELEDAIEHGARTAMARDERLADHARTVGDACARQLLGERPTAAQLAARRRETRPAPTTTSAGWPAPAWPAANPRAAVALPPVDVLIRGRAG